MTNTSTVSESLPKRNPFSAQVDVSKFTASNFEKATDEEKAQAEAMGESTTFWRDVWRRLKRNKLAMGSLVILAIILVAIIVIPILCPYSYETMITLDGQRLKDTANLQPFEYSETEQEWMAENNSLLWPHILGTDSLGRDYFIRVLYGTRVSLAVGFVAAIMETVIGVLYGTIAGYFGGKVDLVMMRIVDVIYSLPDTLLIILLSVVLNENLSEVIEGTFLAALGSNIISMFIVFGLLYWVSMARLVRGQILSIKNNEYVLAAQATGASAKSIMFKHIIPNCLPIIIITAALQVPSAIFTESYLSFIGLGVSAPMPSLGSLANSARDSMQSYPIRLIAPATVITLIVLALNLLGDGLRDATDTKLK